jgi:hypothetical protein
MAIMDVQLELSDAQAIVADAQSTNVINWNDTDLEMGTGTPLYLNIVVGTDFAGGTSLQFKLYSHSAATSIQSGTLLYETAVFAQATLVTGYKVLRMPLPAKSDAEQYLGLYYDDTGEFTGGTIDAWIDYGSQSSHDTQVAQS